jgi:thiamine biosynthesis protein ThiS
MNLFVNGERKTVASGITIAQIIDLYKIIPATIVVELNEIIAQPEMYDNMCLTEGDRLEFIRFVGGG